MRALFVSVVLLAACGSSSSSGYDPAPAPPADSGAPSADPGPTDYPRGPYGMEEGNVFPDVTLQGYHAAAGAWTTIKLKDYYDADGSRGIRGLYLTIAAPWCEACVAEGKTLPDRYANEYKAKGARFLAAVAQDDAHQPATQKTVDDWISVFKTNYDIAADGSLQTAPKNSQGGGSIALPYSYVIDPRTMRIAQINSGPFFTSGGIPGLDGVIQKNAK
jgi:hypothetical protein